ncbi:hypothetical protein DNA05_08265 [Campylobacter coli]|uniref:hypothetical protein n=1 Tax=Campylobacter TaxID=194 RepID=UPI00042E2B2C|nr:MULTISPECIES: hypothetical protein [Campylobacter]AHK75964.1 hypothetical protein YSU_08950 [Campylobacter coli RM5611]ARJ52077.1 hypothetical protein B0D73_00180 [Campylobacter jejuni]EAB5361684.1 hypothetical protein [Campylobacter jejuni]EAC1595255.1 hypothetical protein [Campylobacter coli]EAC1929656.1 hypothetical protein [Campylobacter coli]
MSDKELQKEILALENDVKQLEATINVIKKRITHLKDIAWDRQSKKESSQMYKVLKDTKEHTRVKSNVGDIKVDKDFMEKEIRKHLDNPNLRGMVTTKEMLSFPKVAKGVRVEFNAEHKDFTWKVKANDENILRYGSREYIQNNKAVNRLLTSYSQTEKGERINNSGNGQTKSALPPLFKDSNFRRPTNENIIPQQNQSVNDFKAKLEEFSTKKTNAIKSINKEFKR